MQAPVTGLVLVSLSLSWFLYQFLDQQRIDPPPFVPHQNPISKTPQRQTQSLEPDRARFSYGKHRNYFSSQ